MAKTFLDNNGVSHLWGKIKSYVSGQLTKANVGLGNVANLDQSKAIKSITRSGTTFTMTALDGTTSTVTQQDTNTWRGIQDNLTSTSTTESLSANQGRLLANGAARDSTKLPLSGGTMTGVLILKGSLYEDKANTGALNAANSNIYGVNSI